MRLSRRRRRTDVCTRLQHVFLSRVLDWCRNGFHSTSPLLLGLLLCLGERAGGGGGVLR